MTYALATIAYLYAFWFVYVGVMGIYRAHLDKRLGRVMQVFCAPAVLVGILMDIAANVLLATIIFVELPREWLVTTRLTRYIKNSNGWRKEVALTVCTNLLDIFDPSGEHCK